MFIEYKYIYSVLFNNVLYPLSVIGIYDCACCDVWLPLSTTLTLHLSKPILYSTILGCQVVATWYTIGCHLVKGDYYE